MKRPLSFLVILSLGFSSGCDNAPVNLQAAVYSNAKSDSSCEALRTDNLVDVPMSPRALGFSLRAPANFDSLRRHPLLVVFPAAGQTSRQSEAFTRFTEPATARGLIVLYPAHRSLSLPQVDRLADLVQTVATDWCVDTGRIFFTGHSDGGTVTQVLAQREEAAIRPTKIAPSAAGIRQADLDELGCLTQMPVMLMHNADDKLFPGFGLSARDWWLACNACDSEARVDEAGCESYPRCAGGTAVSYCESSGGHRTWPQTRKQILDFLLGPEAS